MLAASRSEPACLEPALDRVAPAKSMEADDLLEFSSDEDEISDVVDAFGRLGIEPTVTEPSKPSPVRVADVKANMMPYVSPLVLAMELSKLE